MMIKRELKVGDWVYQANDKIIGKIIDFSKKDNTCVVSWKDFERNSIQSYGFVKQTCVIINSKIGKILYAN